MKSVIIRISIFITFVFTAATSIAAFGQTNGNENALGDELPTSYYSSDYDQARNKFLNAATISGAKLEIILHPDTGPNENPLYTDVAVIGSTDAKHILMLVSGTHGIEGFTGSGIQTGVLQEGVGVQLDPHIAIVMVHAINPYGFAYLRRVNEDNVDLNRNFVNHSLPYPENPEYEKLSNAIAPQSLSFLATFYSNLRLFWYQTIEGKDQLQCAITAGQYSHPDGLFYGGNRETWSNETIRYIVKKYISRAEHAVIIGIHTGLGPYGKGEIILNEPKESLAYNRAVSWWGTEITKSTVNAESVSCHVSGPLKLAYAKMLPDTELTAVSLEFGTYPGKDVFAALRADNWLHHHGESGKPVATKIKQEMRRVFYPESNEWKNRIWNQAKEIIKQALIGLK